MTTKFSTPPWHVEVTRDERLALVYRAVFSSEEISPGHFKYVVSPGSYLSERDMILIAAAPELLEALKSAKYEIERLQGGFAGPVCEQIAAAIIRAEEGK